MYIEAQKCGFGPQSGDTKIKISQVATIGHMCDYPHFNNHTQGFYQAK